jgi:hypothetical protein
MYGSSHQPHGGHQLSWFMTMNLYEWLFDGENDSNTGDGIIFRQIQMSRRIIALHTAFFVLLSIIDVVVVLLESAPTLLLYPRGQGL